MNGTELELRREIWMWRGVGILLLLMLLVTNIITFVIDRGQHAIDNRERAAAWQGLNDKADRTRAMIAKNYDELRRNGDAIKAVENGLERCSQCHSHKRGTPLRRDATRPVN